MKTIHLILLAALGLPAVAADWSILSPDEKPTQLLTENLRRQMHAELDERLMVLERLETPDQIREYQRRLKALFRENLGEHQAEKTPLQVRPVGSVAGDGYTIEKLIYESRPNFYVTANFYRPHTPPPYPAVLVPCGHTANGKAGYQKVGLILARNGIAALVYDPVGQGERKQVLKKDAAGQPLPAGKFSATLEHSITGVAPILLGQGLATYRIWDGIRSLDYLVSRPDVDAAKIGCTGNSGGGLMTGYLMALDDRIQAAAPGCYITTKRIKMDRPGPGDAEQNVFRQIADGPDHPDMIIMRAPKPTLILAATKDFVPIEGSWIAYRQAKRIYTKLGFSERVGLVEANEKHGFTEPLRVAMTRFMRRWLLGVDDAVTEGELPEHSDAELQCTPTGQVLLMDGAKSLADLYRELAAEQVGDRPKEFILTNAYSLHLKGYDPHLEIRERGKVRKLVIRSVDGFPLPTLHFPHTIGSTTPVLLVSDRGLAAEAVDPNSVLRRYFRQGREVFAVDVRGFGETKTRAWRASGEYFGNNGAEFFFAYQVGRSLMGARMIDVMAAEQSLRSSGEHDLPMELVGVGAAGPVVLHAAAMNPGRYPKVTTIGAIESWQTVFDSPVTIHQLENTAHAAWKFYDLPDLVKVIGPEKVVIENPVDVMGRPLTDR
jgi:dienelactone hydrolase